MKKTEIRSASNEELIRRFEETAVIHGELRTAKEANRAFKEALAIWKELKQRGGEAVSLFLTLLSSTNSAVRGTSAACALFVAPEQAEPVLEQLSKEQGLPGFAAFSAEMTLREWRAGRLTPLEDL